MKICSAALTDCRFVQDGHAIGIDLVDDKGAAVSLELPFEQARAIAKRLPSLLAPPLQAHGSETGERCVLALDRWTVERSDDGTGLLLTLATGDGYEVCFNLPDEACGGLGRVLENYNGPLINGPIRRTAAPSSEELD
jgi:hypothetical protein